MNRTGRLPRIHIPNTIHHVMIRGNNRQKIFFNEECFLFFLKIIEESAEKYDHKILSYCLMTNHVHLIVHIHQDSLSIVMKNINFRYARWFNHQYSRIGHLFQGRYRSIAVDDEKYLINLCHYIHFNPCKAGMTAQPDYYEWSSHQHYLSKNAPIWMEMNLILNAIKNKTGYSYLVFMKKSIERENWKPDFFISETGELIINDSVRDLHPFLNSNENIIQSISHEIVSEVVCRNLNITYDRLLNASRDRKNSHYRALLAHFLLTYTNLKVSDIAKYFCRTQATLKRQIDQLERTANKNYYSEDLLEKIRVELDCARLQRV